MSIIMFKNLISDTIKIFHNPRCSKSRAAMDLLTDKGIKVDVVKYLETPPDRETLEQILEMLNMQPRELMRKGEAEYIDNNLSDESLTRDQLIGALLEFPKLLERPIVVSNGKAAIGRPIENIIDIL
ncbi:MAG: arsenate reductase [Cocleimonas sp.]|jgi:arsenate reductase